MKYGIRPWIFLVFLGSVQPIWSTEHAEENNQTQQKTTVFPFSPVQRPPSLADFEFSVDFFPVGKFFTNASDKASNTFWGAIRGIQDRMTAFFVRLIYNPNA